METELFKILTNGPVTFTPITDENLEAKIHVMQEQIDTLQRQIRDLGKLMVQQSEFNAGIIELLKK